jgi:hypothetical protein
MAIFNSKPLVYQRVPYIFPPSKSHFSSYDPGPPVALVVGSPSSSSRRCVSQQPERSEGTGQDQSKGKSLGAWCGPHGSDLWCIIHIYMYYIYIIIWIIHIIPYITGGTTRLLSGMHRQVEQNGAKTKFTKWTWDPEKKVPLNKCASGWTCFSFLWNLMKLDLKKWHELCHTMNEISAPTIGDPTGNNPRIQRKF